MTTYRFDSQREQNGADHRPESHDRALDAAVSALRASEIKYRGLADLVPEQVWTAAPTGELDYVNARVCSYFGQTAEAILGNGWLTVLHPDDVEATVAVWTNALATGEPYEIEFRLRRADGAHRTHIGRAFPLRDDDGHIVRWFGTNTDVADERELHRLAAIVEYSDDAIIGTSPEGLITDWNHGAERLYGYSREAVVGRHLSMLASDRHRQDVRAGLERVVEGGVVESLDARRVDSQGRTFDVSLNASPIRDETGSILGVSMIERDITDRKRMERQLAHQALHDGLTGLPNRALFMQRLEAALSERRCSDRAVAVLFVDLDNFKLINDSLGHSRGDALLASVPGRITPLVRRGDVVARFGGDEFMVLSEGLPSAADGVRLAERIVAAFDEPFDLDGVRHFVRASVGIAFSDGAADEETLISNADAAMYLAKERGRSRHEVFDESVRARVTERLDIEARLRRALASDELTLHYQPIVRLGGRAPVGFEALLRWFPVGEPPVSPAQFIPVAEQSGLIVPIGERVLYEACRQAARWQARDPNLRMSVNVSAHQLADPGLEGAVRAALRQSGLPAHRLCLEITESTLMDQRSRAGELLDGLRALGVNIALDDFGTGFSSLSYLRLLPLDSVKIDRSFVAELGSGPKNEVIIDAIVRLASGLGLRVVGEGIETPEQLERLAQLGCDEGQGYLLSRPVPAEDATALVATQL